MFETYEQKNWRVLVATAALLLIALVLGFQFFRTNQTQIVAVEKVSPYATPGPVIEDNLVIGAGDFFSTRIDLNRKAKILGEFRTSSVKSNVSVLVLDEQNFGNWKSGVEYRPVTGTGSVPGGRIGPTLDPGRYFLVISNRSGEKTGYLRADFSVE